MSWWWSTRRHFRRQPMPLAWRPLQMAIQLINISTVISIIKTLTKQIYHKIYKIFTLAREVRVRPMRAHHRRLPKCFRNIATLIRRRQRPHCRSNSPINTERSPLYRYDICRKSARTESCWPLSGWCNCDTANDAPPARGPPRKSRRRRACRRAAARAAWSRCIRARVKAIAVRPVPSRGNRRL